MGGQALSKIIVLQKLFLRRWFFLQVLSTTEGNMPKRAVLKKIFIFALSVIFWTGVLALVKPDKTLAYFGDSEASSANTFSAGPLDFSLSSPQDFSPQGICQETASREIDLFNQGNPFHYKIVTSEVSGDLCNYINLTANLNGGAPECAGPLVGFDCEDFIFSGPAGSPPEQWHFTANLTDGAPKEAVCNFKLLFAGRQLNFDVGGFHDEEEIASTISSGSCGPNLVINKIYYDVDSSHGQETKNEWVEIYNPSDEPVDISGWFIKDNGATSTIPNASPIPSHGFALLTGNSSTWTTYWKAVPPETVKIVLPGAKIGNGLANDGDRLILKDPSGRIVDQMSYEGDTSIFDPAPPLNTSGNSYNLPEGHILGRDPTGYDTDTADDWHDFGIPQVTVTYPSGGTWYCHQNVTLRWQATNPNGPNSDLAITLLYIRDLDKNGVVSSGDDITTIAQDIANTGSYAWQVSPCYLGYVWIKVIATGPENFMVQGNGLSGRVYEPSEENTENTTEEATPQGIFEETEGEGTTDSLDISGDETITPQEDRVSLSSNRAEQTDEVGQADAGTDQTQNLETGAGNGTTTTTTTTTTTSTTSPSTTPATSTPATSTSTPATSTTTAVATTSSATSSAPVSSEATSSVATSSVATNSSLNATSSTETGQEVVDSAGSQPNDPDDAENQLSTQEDSGQENETTAEIQGTQGAQETQETQETQGSQIQPQLEPQSQPELEPEPEQPQQENTL